MIVVVALAFCRTAEAKLLCDDGDSIVFTCELKNSKIVSVCRKGKTGVYYRYGQYLKYEFDYPGGMDPAFTRQQLDLFGGGKENILSFDPVDGVHFNVDSIDTDAAHTGNTTVEHGVKAQCRPATILSQWYELDEALPPTAPPPAKGGMSASGKLVCADGATALIGEWRKMADAFRKFAEKEHKFYEFAVAQFGSPQSCAFDMTGAGPKSSTEYDERSYVGKLTYVFSGATLVVVVERWHRCRFDRARRIQERGAGDQGAGEGGALHVQRHGAGEERRRQGRHPHAPLPGPKKTRAWPPT